MFIWAPEAFFQEDDIAKHPYRDWVPSLSFTDFAIQSSEDWRARHLLNHSIIHNSRTNLPKLNGN